MPRTTYRNGAPIGLEAHGCDGCSPARINGTLCHETGCPDAWRDAARECDWCGIDFAPEDRHAKNCPDCQHIDDPDRCGACGAPEWDCECSTEPTECEECGADLDTDCDGRPRCPECDEPCPRCSDV